MKLFLDDIRNPPDSSWVVVRSYQEAIDKLPQATIISLDHDLGTKEDGADVADAIYKAVYLGQSKFPLVGIHSANPVGRADIERIIRRAEEYAGCRMRLTEVEQEALGLGKPVPVLDYDPSENES